VKKLTLLIPIAFATCILFPKPAQAQWFDFGQRAAEFCSQDGGQRCVKVFQWPVNQVFVPEEIRGRNFIEQYFYDRQLMEDQHLQQFNEGNYQVAPSHGYGGW
jgi:hypothetical protein